MSIVKGIEIEVAPVRRAADSPRPIVLHLTKIERAFLLFRIKDVSATAESILHHPSTGQMVSPWTRDMVVQRVLNIRDHLRRADKDTLFVLGPLDKMIVADAIEHNPFFAMMHDSDPRLKADSVRQANALRERVNRAFGWRIASVPLGKGRTRLPT